MDDVDLENRVAPLHNALAGLEPPFIKEHSVKAKGGVLNPGRCLISVPRRQLGPGPKEVLRQICTDLGAPPSALARIDPFQGAATQIHFGLEPRGQSRVHKCYLEFTDDTTPVHGLVFLAIKWDEAGRVAVSRYQNKPKFDLPVLQDLVTTGQIDAAVGNILADFISLGAVRVLEVVDETSARRSFDLNMSGLGYRLCDQHDRLWQLLGQSDEARDYLADHADDWLGHVAAGIGADGLAFTTLYHGAHRTEVLS